MIGGFSLPEILIYIFASFGAAVLSGIAGGGGGFINTPLLIFFGLSPAQAVATGKLSGLSISTTSLGGLHGVQRGSKKQIAVIMVMALVIGLLAPFAITRLDSDIYRKILGAMLLAMIPVLILKKVGRTRSKPTAPKKVTGYLLILLALGLQGVFSGGLGTLVNIILMMFLGLSAVEANVTKRFSQVVLNAVIVVGVFFSGLIVWPIAAVGIITAGVGGYVGGRLAAKRGNGFIMAVFIVLMFVSAMELLFG